MSDRIPIGPLEPDDPTNWQGTGWTEAQARHIQETGKLPPGPLAPTDPQNWHGTGWTKDQMKQFAESDRTLQMVRTIPAAENENAKHVAQVGAALIGANMLGGSGGAGDGSDGGSSGGSSGGFSPTDFVTGMLPHKDDGSIDWGKVFGGVLDVSTAVANYQRQQRADALGKKAADLATEQFGLNQPLRDAGRAGMLDPSSRMPDVSGLRRIATTGSGNPFAGAPIPLNPAAAFPGATTRGPTPPAPPIAVPSVGQRPPTPVLPPNRPTLNPQSAIPLTLGSTGGSVSAPAGQSASPVSPVAPISLSAAAPLPAMPATQAMPPIPLSSAYSTALRNTKNLRTAPDGAASPAATRLAPIALT